jgi:WD40 repeat protein
VADGDELEGRFGLVLWDLTDDAPFGSPLATGDLPPNVVAALSSDGTYVAAAESGRLIVQHTWLNEGEDLDFTLDALPFAIADVWFAADGSLVAHDGAGTVARWTLQTEASSPSDVRQVPRGESFGFIRAAAPGGRHVIVEIESSVDPGVINRLVQIVDTGSGERRDLDWADGGAIAFSDDGSALLVSGQGGRLRVLRLDSALTWTEDASLPTTATAAAFSQDSRLVAVGAPAENGEGPSVQVWDLATGSELGRVSLASQPTAMAFTADDRRLVVATASPDGDRHSIFSLDAAQPEEVTAVFASGPGMIDSLWIADDGIVTGLSDRGLALQWDLGTGLLVASGPIPRKVKAPDGTTTSLLGARALAPDGSLVGGGGGRVWLWSVADLAAQHLRPVEITACALAGRNLTDTEWQRYLPDEPYHRTCPDYPDGQ